MITLDEAQRYIDADVCVHWDEGSMQGIGMLIDNENYFVVDYGYGVSLSDITEIHDPKDCKDG